MVSIQYSSVNAMEDKTTTSTANKELQAIVSDRLIATNKARALEMLESMMRQLEANAVVKTTPVTKESRN